MWQEARRIFVDAFADVVRAAARILPSVLAMLLFFALAAVLAVAIRWGARRGCERLGLDERLREWGVARRHGGASPSRIVARVAFWAVLLAGALLGISVLELPVAATLSMHLVEYLPRALVALVTLGIGLAAGRFVERSVLIGAVNMGLQSARLIALGARWMIVLLAAAIALEHAGVGGGVVLVAFGTLVGGIVLALALAVGLGAKDVVARSLERQLRDRGPGGGRLEQDPDADRGRVHHL